MSTRRVTVDCPHCGGTVTAQDTRVDEVAENVPPMPWKAGRARCENGCHLQANDLPTIDHF